MDILAVIRPDAVRQRRAHVVHAADRRQLGRRVCSRTCRLSRRGSKSTCCGRRTTSYAWRKMPSVPPVAARWACTCGTTRPRRRGGTTTTRRPPPSAASATSCTMRPRAASSWEVRSPCEAPSRGHRFDRRHPAAHGRGRPALRRRVRGRWLGVRGSVPAAIRARAPLERYERLLLIK